MFNTRRLVFRHTRDLQVVLREGTASVLRAWTFCQNGPVLDGTEALSAASQLPKRTVGGGAGHGLHLRGVVTCGHVIRAFPRRSWRDSPWHPQGALCSPGARPFRGLSDCRATPGMCPAPAVLKMPVLGLRRQQHNDFGEFCGQAQVVLQDGCEPGDLSGEALLPSLWPIHSLLLCI